MTRRSGFTLIELMIVVAIVGIFAGIVIPRFADASRPLPEPVAQLLEADLRRARTEAMALGAPVVAVASTDGAAWWLAPSAEPTTPIAGTERRFGSGGLAPMKGATLLVKGDGESHDDRGVAHRVFAEFDSLGSRDEGVPCLELRSRDGERIAAWTLPAGRTRLAR